MKRPSDVKRNGNTYIAGWSSLVARRAHNPKVVGSNPAPATSFSGAPFQGLFVSWTLYSVGIQRRFRDGRFAHFFILHSMHKHALGGSGVEQARTVAGLVGPGGRGPWL